MTTGSISAAEQRYPIHLNRAMKVGARYKLHSIGARRLHSDLSEKDKPPVTHDGLMRIELQGMVTVEAVDRHGEESRLSIEIEKCEKATPSGSAEMLAPGTILAAESKEGKTIFALKSRPATPEESSALLLVVATHGTDAPTIDDVYGTDKPRLIGEVWAINAERCAASFRQSGLNADPANIKGEGTLVAIETVRGHECERVRIQCVAAGLVAAGADLKSAPVTKLTSAIVAVLPLDSKVAEFAVRSESRKLTVSQGTSSAGVAFTQTTTVDETREKHFFEPKK